MGSSDIAQDEKRMGRLGHGNRARVGGAHPECAVAVSRGSLPVRFLAMTGSWQRRFGIATLLLAGNAFRARAVGHS